MPLYGSGDYIHNQEHCGMCWVCLIYKVEVTEDGAVWDPHLLFLTLVFQDQTRNSLEWQGSFPKTTRSTRSLYRYIGFGAVKKIYGPVRGILLTMWTDVLSRWLLLTVKSMLINTHLLLTTQCPVISRKDFKHCFPKTNCRFWSSPKTCVGMQLAPRFSQGCNVKYQKVFLKICYHLPSSHRKTSTSPVSHDGKYILENWVAETEASNP